MIWDFRVIRKRVNNQDVYALHRVFYADSMKRQALLIESLPSTIVGIEPISMLEEIELMTNAFDSPTIYVPEWNFEGDKNE